VRSHGLSGVLRGGDRRTGRESRRPDAVDRRLGVQLRVPDDRDGAVSTALGDAPLAFDRTDHRGVPGPAGDVVTIVHFGARGDDVDRESLVETLAAVGAALAV
jgi:hypothetical protein